MMNSKLEIIYLKHSGVMYNRAYAILNNRNDAEDAVSEAFLRLLKNIKKVDDPESIKTRNYAVIAAESCAIDIYRKKKRLSEVELDDDSDYQMSGKFETNECTCDNELTEQIMRLSPRYRNILLLKYVYGADYQEIAQLMNITEGNARKLLQRAKEKLEKYCREKGLL